MNKYFIYCRKSSEQEDRQVLSLDSQEQELTKIAKEQSLHIVGLYKESGSAHVTGRKLFNEMLERIEKGEANSLLVWDESRIARNSKDGGNVIYMMDLEQLAEIRKPGRMYQNTPDDKGWLGFIFTATKKESDDKSVNVKRGLKTKAGKGWLPSGAKPGYMNDKYAEKGNKTILSDPVRFSLIRKSWDMMLTGLYTPPYILDKLNNEWGYRTPQHKKIGGKPMSRSMIYKVFIDPFYYGEFEYPLGSGIWQKGKHEAMITKEEFERVQILLGRKGKLRVSKHNFDYTGLMRCGECEASITAEEKWQVICTTCKTKFHKGEETDSCKNCQTLIEEMKNPKILHYVYYHCTKKKNPNCPQGSLELDKLEKQIDKVLSNVQISERFKIWAIKHLNELNTKETEDRNVVLGSIQGAYSDVVKRLDNLLKLKISPQNIDGGLLSDEEYRIQKTKLINEKNSLEGKMSNTGEKIERWMEDAEEKFNFALHASYWFTNGDSQKKREIFQGLGQNLILKDKILLPDLEKPLQFIEEMRKAEPLIAQMLEPEEKTDNSVQMETLWSQNPSLLRD